MRTTTAGAPGSKAAGPLAGRRAIVTGSTRGLGRAYARALAEAGASVVVNGTTQALVEEVVAGLVGAGHDVIGHCGSVASVASADALVGAGIAAFGGVDILVNNAGVVAERMMFNMTEEEFRGPYEVDGFGTFAVSRFAVRDMRLRGWGRIINVADTSAQTGLLGGTNVAAAKGAILGMTFTWASELIRWGITANCVIPNAYSRMHDPLYRKAIELAQARGDDDIPTFEEMVARATPPAAITPFVVYLATDDAGWINGQVFSISRRRIALWSHAHEKEEMRSVDGFTLDGIRAAAQNAFADAVEPVGVDEPWSKTDWTD